LQNSPPFRRPAKPHGWHRRDPLQVKVTVCAPLLVPIVPLANVRLSGETLTGEERVPSRPTTGRLLAEGVNLIWANADQPGTRRESKKAVRPKNGSVPYFAGLELELGK